MSSSFLLVIASATVFSVDVKKLANKADGAGGEPDYSCTR